MTATGPHPEHVVQVRATPSFGSGYRIAQELVLTAAHVVAEDNAEPVRSVTVARPGQEPVEGRVVWCRKDSAVDAALIRVQVSGAFQVSGASSKRAGPTTRVESGARGPTAVHGEPTVWGGTGDPSRTPPVRYGTFVSARPDQPVDSIGFPRAQKSELLRDQEHFSGLLSPATAAAAGHYEATSITPMPGGPSGAKATPWAGMSGAALFAAGLLVGVIRQDRRPSRGTLLTATPMSSLLADEDFRRVVAEAAGHDPICEPVELSGLFAAPYAARELPSAFSLLRADSEVVSFHGREAALAQLSEWCTGPADVSVLIVTGQGGEGKSRLARHFLTELRSVGWTAGLLRPALSDDAVTEDLFTPIPHVRGPLLIAVDYAETRPRQVRALLRQARAAQGPIRLLLIARERGLWAEALDEPDPDVRDLLAGAADLELEPLAPTEEVWDATFRQAIADLALALPAVPGHAGHDWSTLAERTAPPPAATHRRTESVLSIHMTALTLLLQQGIPAAAASGEPVERTLLRHEEAYWTRTAHRCGLHGLDPATLRSAVAALHLVVVADRSQAVSLLDHLGVVDSDRGRMAARWLHELYPPVADAYCGAAQPDRLAEYLVVTACADDSDLLLRVVTAAAGLGDPKVAAYFAAHPNLGDASGYNQMMALREAVRTTRSQAHFGHDVSALLMQIERVASLPVVSEETLAWTVANVQTLPPASMRQRIITNPDGSMTVTGLLDHASAALLVAGHRRGTHAKVSNAQDQGHVHLLHAQSLLQLNRPGEALEATERAVTAFGSASGSEDMLAAMLHQQGELLLPLNRQEEAVTVLHEAIRLHAPEGPAEEQGVLRRLLDMLVVTLCKLGHFRQALPYSRWETELLARTAGPEADAARPYLISLTRFAQVLSGSAEHQWALACTARAETFLSGLPAATRDELIAERALLADTEAEVHGAVGNRHAEVDAWLEAARLWQRLEAPYQGLLPSVRMVMALNNAAVGHHALGHSSEALRLMREAVEVTSGERGEPVRRHRPILCEEIRTTYIGHLTAAGRAEDALREAERLWLRPGVSTNPLKIRLATILRQVSVALVDASKPRLAAGASGLALTVLDALQEPASGLPLLAGVLLVHAANLTECQEPAEGLEVSDRAVGLWRRMAATDPRMRVNVALALRNRSTCLYLLGRSAEAAYTALEAASTLRAEAQSSGHLLPLFADMLGQQAALYTEAEAHAEAAAAREEEVAVRRELWQRDPSAGTRAARAMSELGMHYKALGRPTDAVTAAATACEAYHELYGLEPGEHWEEFAQALMRYGTALLMTGLTVEAVAPLVQAMGMCLQAGSTEFADRCLSGIGMAHAVNPAGVEAEWRRMVGNDFPL